MPTTALLVIDLQRGAFDGQRCPPIDRPETLVDRAVALIDAARDAGKPVVFIQHGEGAGQPFETGTVHWALHERLQPRPGDAVVGKSASSAFQGTDLAGVLAAADAGELVLCGLQSEFCVSNTAKAALALGYRVVVAEDAHGTWPSDDRLASAIVDEVNAALAVQGAVLRSTADLARDLRSVAA